MKQLLREVAARCVVWKRHQAADNPTTWGNSEVIEKGDITSQKLSCSSYYFNSPPFTDLRNSQFQDRDIGLVGRDYEPALALIIKKDIKALIASKMRVWFRPKKINLDAKYYTGNNSGSKTSRKQALSPGRSSLKGMVPKVQRGD
ncbi:hypothetical protein WAI453_001383 [Rhynchosporium graminicola]